MKTNRFVLFAWLLSSAPVTLVLGTLALATLASATVLLADATDRVPGGVVNAHGTVAEASAIYAQAVAAEKQLQEFVTQAETGVLGEQQMSKGAMLGEQVVWQARTLNDYYEPAANDLALRAVYSQWRIRNEIELFLQTPKGAQFYQRLTANLDSPKAVKQRAAALEQIIKLVQKKEFESAENMLGKTYANLWPDAGYLWPAARIPLFKPFQEAEGIIRNEMGQRRQAKARAALAEKAKLWTAQRDTLNSTVAEAISQMQASGKATLGAQPLLGPEALSQLFDRWGAVHHSLVQFAMAQYAITEGDQALLTLEADRMATMMEKCATEFLVADATRADAEAAKSNYVRYLQVISDTANKVNRWRNSDIFNDAFAKLASRAGMKTPVESYALATDEMMRWRQQYALEKKRTIEEEFPSLETQFKSKLLSSGENLGLFALQQEFPLPLLNHSAYKVIPNLVTQMMKLKVSANDVVRLDGETPRWMIRYHDGIYGRLPAQIKLESGAAGLMNDLIVDADHPPLTLRATAAIRSLERGEFDVVGGEIVGIEMSSFATRFITMPAVGAALVARDDLPASSTDQRGLPRGHGLDSVLVQFSIQPRWVAHRYFVSPVASN